MKGIEAHTPKPTGASYKLAGETFYAWHVGVLRYESRDISGRIRIGDNGHHRSTYWAMVDDHMLATRFLSKDTAAKAAIKLREAAPVAGSRSPE